ncbi:hypothetical protein ANN_07043 [Periplaneta americana]|uniref:Reverse transcriptase n=1 Tax=Periplaneta americana TaxID=6978 RepID=A0ABQ8TFX3_PERAM|nr:hypothetical protein ANN_07043 [Periplaneta americana]
MSCNVTAMRSVPGRTVSTTRCRHSGCSETETLGHVLGFCKKGELLRNNRHHRSRTAIANLLRNRGWEVHEEIHCVSEDDSHRRVDVIAINRRPQKAMVSDPMICFERVTNQALQINNDKRAKYVPYLPYLSQKYGISLFNWDVTGLLFAERGSANIIPANPKLTSDLGFIKANFGKLPAYITKLETRSIPLHTAVQVTKKVETILKGIPSSVGETMRNKYLKIVERNPGWEQVLLRIGNDIDITAFPLVWSPAGIGSLKLGLNPRHFDLRTSAIDLGRPVVTMLTTDPQLESSNRAGGDGCLKASLGRKERPVLCYGSEAWTLKKKDESRITANEMKFMRYTAGYTKWDHKRNEDVMEELQLEPVINHGKHYRNNWINHLHRMRRDRIPKVMLHYRPNGKRYLGRPKKRWIENSTVRS